MRKHGFTSPITKHRGIKPTPCLNHKQIAAMQKALEEHAQTWLEETVLCHTPLDTQDIVKAFAQGFIAKHRGIFSTPTGS